MVDADAGTVKVVVGLSDLGQLAPGMWVKVELVLDRKESAVLIPKRAVTYNVDRASVFKAIMDDKRSTTCPAPASRNAQCRQKTHRARRWL